MILRIVLGHLPPGKDGAALVRLRDRLTRAARAVSGLESLIVGARRVSAIADDDAPIEAAIATVWRDVEAMTRATAIDEESRFIAARLDLPLAIERTDHYEIIGRTFAALPPESTALLRILTVRARSNEEARLFETLRDQQPRLVDLGLVASHLGRRLIEGGEVEAVNIGVWPDRATIRAATAGRPEAPLFALELGDWLDRLHLEMYDGLEIAPRLPAVSGPPLFIIDDELRIVDITSSAAAMLGMPAGELVGKRVDELSPGDPASGDSPWPGLLGSDLIEGETRWSVPDVGSVILRYVARQDVPIPGRHAILVRRRQDPPPQRSDLDAAIAAAFPQRDAP